MPGKVPAGDETVLYALPEDQPDSLSKGQSSKQADLDATPAEKAGGRVKADDDSAVAEEKPAKKAAPRKRSK